MSTVWPMQGAAASGALPADQELGAVRSAAELVEVMDDRTRTLLGRRRHARRAHLVPRWLMLADLIGLGLAYFLATILAGGNALGSDREVTVFVLTLPCWVVVAQLHGLYARDQERANHSTTDEVVAIFHLVTIGVWLLLVASRLTGRSGGPSVYALITFWALAVCILPVARVLVRESCKRSGAFVQNAVIVGAGEVGQLIGRKLARHPEYGVNVVGFVDRRPKTRHPDLPEHLTLLGPPEQLPEIVQSLDVERVVIAFSNEPGAELLAVARRLRHLPVQIDLVPRLFEVVDPRAAIHAVEGIPLLGLPPSRRANSARAVKRAIDVAGATAGLILFAPLFAYVAVRIRLDSKGPVLFRQTRLGRNMKEFTTLKFRTMRVDADPAIHQAFIRSTMGRSAIAAENGLYKLDRTDAVTEVGSWLRRTSFDELPQLINVLRGEMSLVGPRPCIPYEVENYQPHHFDRFLVPQGITGLWQVTARAHATYGESLQMDVAYARGWSLGLDLRLLLRTPIEVFRQRSCTR
jgi:exopolysaccharide biosynthesis polyprenyl glycosylphosphotransferase